MIKFDEKVLFDTNVEYQYATRILNNDGKTYDEYGIHDEKYNIDAIFYDGSVYQGKKTKVFAYLGIPKNASSKNPVPAVVCVHGGWGKAEISWVKKWNDVGYAAIAMDLYGNGPEDGVNEPDDNTGKLMHPYGGMAPWNDYGTAFLRDRENAGMYHNVVNVINAHNLLRSLSCIDSSKTGITGISWGGITTTIISGIDHRFKFAAPVYGCGFLYQCQSYFKNAFDKNEATSDWDPADFAKNAKMPVLYINGDTDTHFSLNATSKTYKVTPNAYISILHNFVHGQSQGESVEQIYSFAKAIFEGNLKYININKAYVCDNIFYVELSEKYNIKSVDAYYITTSVLPFGGGENVLWKKAEKYAFDNNIIRIELPEEAKCFYCSITDCNGAVISTELVLRD